MWIVLIRENVTAGVSGRIDKGTEKRLEMMWCQHGCHSCKEQEVYNAVRTTQLHTVTTETIDSFSLFSLSFCFSPFFRLVFLPFSSFFPFVFSHVFQLSPSLFFLFVLLYSPVFPFVFPFFPFLFFFFYFVYLLCSRFCFLLYFPFLFSPFSLPLSSPSLLSLLSFFFSLLHFFSPSLPLPPLLFLSPLFVPPPSPSPLLPTCSAPLLFFGCRPFFFGCRPFVFWLSSLFFQVRLRSATGDDMGVSDSFMVRGWCDNQVLELTALEATRATRSLCSATKLMNAGYSVEMRPTQSVFVSQWRRLHTASTLR